MDHQSPFIFREIGLPKGHVWKGKSTFSMEYPPPASMTGECLGIIGHSGDLEHTLHTFYKNIWRIHIPTSGRPEQDFMILSPDIYGRYSFYFSIAEMLSFRGKDITFEAGWEIFKQLLHKKTQEKQDALGPEAVRDLQEEIALRTEVNLSTDKEE